MELLKTIPFFYKSHTAPHNNGIPLVFPFNLYYDDELKMFRQKSSIELKKYLDEIYKQGSLLDGSISSESGKVYIDKVVNYLFEHFVFKNDSKILEVGFGSGVLLKELKIRGVKNLFGIEPGNHKMIEGLEGITLIEDFFPSKQFTEKVDLIYSFAILEHLEDPLTFLNQQISQVSENGKIIFSVPNCEPYLIEGDLSVFIHEHYSYFTIESIINLVNKTSFKVEDISIIEGALIVTIQKNDFKFSYPFQESIKENFINKSTIELNKIRLLLKKYSENQIAIYTPIRALNILHVLKKTDIRLVDDNSELHKKYLPTLTSAIESFDEMINNPPKCILIFSRTFGTRIKNKCKSNSKLKNTLVLTLNDLKNN